MFPFLKNKTNVVLALCVAPKKTNKKTPSRLLALNMCPNVALKPRYTPEKKRVLNAVMLMHRFHWVKPGKITDTQFRQIVSEIPPLCTKYDNAGVILQFIMRYNLHDYTCPAVRYLYPLHWLFSACQALLGWTYYGSAAPFTNVEDENCIPSTDTAQDYICCGIGIGFLILGRSAVCSLQSAFCRHAVLLTRNKHSCSYNTQWVGLQSFFFLFSWCTLL